MWEFFFPVFLDVLWLGFTLLLQVDIVEFCNLGQWKQVFCTYNFSFMILRHHQHSLLFLRNFLLSCGSVLSVHGSDQWCQLKQPKQTNGTMVSPTKNAFHGSTSRAVWISIYHCREELSNCMLCLIFAKSKYFCEISESRNHNTVKHLTLIWMGLGWGLVNYSPTPCWFFLKKLLIADIGKIKRVLVLKGISTCQILSF